MYPVTFLARILIGLPEHINEIHRNVNIVHNSADQCDANRGDSFHFISFYTVRINLLKAYFI